MQFFFFFFASIRITVSSIVHQMKQLACSKGPCGVKRASEQEDTTHKTGGCSSYRRGSWEMRLTRRITHLPHPDWNIKWNRPLYWNCTFSLSLNSWIWKLNVCLVHSVTCCFLIIVRTEDEEVAEDELRNTGVIKTSRVLGQEGCH